MVRGASVADIEETRAALHSRADPARALGAGARCPDFEQIDAILSEYSAELRSHNVKRWGELNTILHSRLYAKAGRPQMRAIVDKLLTASDRYTRLQLLHTDGLERAEQEHAEIVELCRKRRFKAAATHLADHIRR